jgi:hypothetical protein
MLRRKALTLVFLSVLLIGCSKDPTTPDLIPAFTITSFSDSLHVFYGSCMLNFSLVYETGNYAKITANSDSETVDIYLSSNKKLSSPGNGGGGKSVETILNKTTITITDTWLPDTISAGLEISDTLAAIDSSIVRVSWWYDGKRYQILKKY